MIEEFTVSADTIRSLNSNLVDQLEMGGVRKVARITEIEWNMETQNWEVRAILWEDRIAGSDGTIHSNRWLSHVLHVAKTYDSAREWEVENADAILELIHEKG